MKNLIIRIYRIVSELMIILSDFPGKKFKLDETKWWLITLVIFSIAIILIIQLIRKNGQYPKLLYLIVGILPIWIMVHYSVSRINGDDLFKQSFYKGWLVLLPLVFAIGFLLVNYLLEKAEGSYILLLWIAEYILGCGIVRVWNKWWTGTSYEFTRIMPAQEFVSSIRNIFFNLNLPTFIFGLVSFIVLVSLSIILQLFLHHACLRKGGNVNELYPVVVSQLMMIVAYIVYNSHKKNSWTAGATLFVVGIFMAGLVLYLLFFIQQIIKKDKNGCIAVVYTGFAGLLGTWALYLCAAMVEKGVIKSFFNVINWIMNFIYQENPLSNYSKLEKESYLVHQWMFVLALGIAIVLVVLVAKIIIDDRGKPQLISQFLIEPLTISWVRNCVISVHVCVLFYWICTIYSDVVGSQLSDLQTIFQIITCFGFGLTGAAFFIPLRKLQVRQLAALMIGLVSGLIPVIILPLILSWI